MTEDEMRKDGELRKARSIARLRAEGVPVIDHLPRIKCDPATIQSVDAIARRTMVLCLLAVYAEQDGMPREVLEKYLDLREVREYLTPNEHGFLAKLNPSEEERGPFSWQYECAQVLLWAMGYVDALAKPTTYCTAKGVSAIVAPRSVRELVQGAALRSTDEMFDECDLIFRYHWAARNAYLRRQEPPAELLAPVCYYRHYALNWLTDSRFNWDEVDTST
jgi:hypothetical protein